MKHCNFLFTIFIIALSGCKNDDLGSSQLQSQDNTFLTKEQVVQGLMEKSKDKTTSTSSRAFGSYGADSTPIDSSTGTPYKLLPSTQFQSEAVSVESVGYAGSLSSGNYQDVDLRPWDTPVKNQGAELTCTAFSAAAAMEIAAKIKTGKTYDLSERHLWSLYQQGAVQAAAIGGSKRPIVSEETWPYRSRAKPATTENGIIRIKKFSSNNLTLKGIIQALQNRQPVIFGGVMPYYDSRGLVHGLNYAGSHAMAAIGVQFDNRVNGGGYLIIKNSFGPRDGDKGYIYLPFTYCAVTQCYARAVEEIEIVGSTENTANEKNSRIMAMIGEAQGSSDNYTMWVSAPNDAAKLVFCTETQASACVPGAKGYTETTLKQTLGNQVIFKSNASLALSQNLQIVVAAFSANGQMVASRNLKFELN